MRPVRPGDEDPQGQPPHDASIAKGSQCEEESHIVTKRREKWQSELDQEAGRKLAMG